MKNKIIVLEPGAFGTVLGILLSKKNEVIFWYQDAKLASQIAQVRINNRLPKVLIPKEILISSDFKKVISNANLLIVATPSYALHELLGKLKKYKNLPPLLGLAKGLENNSCLLPSQIVQKYLKEIPYAHLSGPGFANAIAQGKATKEIIASDDRFFLKEIKRIFSNIKILEIETTKDLIGLQLAGALKNVVAIGMGIAESEIKEQSAREKLLAVGLEEMIKLGVAMGAKKETFQGSAGLGDLLLTSSDESRNYQFGKKIFSEEFLEIKKRIRGKKFTSEGFHSAKAAFLLGRRYKVSLPFINEIYYAIFKNRKPEKTHKNLLKLVCA